jgi:hypothetical protein
MMYFIWWPGTELTPDASLFSLAVNSICKNLTGLRWLRKSLKIRGRCSVLGLRSWAGVGTSASHVELKLRNSVHFADPAPTRSELCGAIRARDFCPKERSCGSSDRRGSWAVSHKLLIGPTGLAKFIRHCLTIQPSATTFAELTNISVAGLSLASVNDVAAGHFTLSGGVDSSQGLRGCKCQKLSRFIELASNGPPRTAAVLFQFRSPVKALHKAEMVLKFRQVVIVQRDRVELAASGRFTGPAISF